MNITEKTAIDYDSNLPPEKLKAATQNEQNDGWLIVKNRPRRDIHHLGGPAAGFCAEQSYMAGAD